jgi:hypothetical protein
MIPVTACGSNENFDEPPGLSRREYSLPLVGRVATIRRSSMAMKYTPVAVAFAYCLVLTLLPAKALADNPAPQLRDRAERLFDPTNDAVALSRFQKVERDKAIPGAPIVSVDIRDNEKLDAIGISVLAKLPYLRSVVTGDLSCSQVRCLAELRQLQELSLYAPDAGADELKVLATLPRLRSLTFGNIVLKEGHLKELAGFHHLVHLDLSGCDGLTDAKVKQIAAFKQLTSLGLANTTVTNAGLAELPSLERLETLNLHHCFNLTGRGLKELARCPRLQNLYLCGCTRLSDADIRELGGLKHLRQLDLRLCERLSQKAIDDLQSKLPECKISSRFDKE